jgi:aromatic ring-opening dioxygenase LigB subunit
VTLAKHFYSKTLKKKLKMFIAWGPVIPLLRIKHEEISAMHEELMHKDTRIVTMSQSKPTK